MWYETIRTDKHQHDGQIVFEIFHQMTRKDAEFRNKETKPHFDIVQQSTIIWKDTSDLKKN